LICGYGLFEETTLDVFKHRIRFGTDNTDGELIVWQRSQNLQRFEPSLPQ